MGLSASTLTLPCGCGPRQACGCCIVCSGRGHLRRAPGLLPFSGAWCDAHFAELERSELAKLQTLALTLHETVAKLEPYSSRVQPSDQNRLPSLTRERALGNEQQTGRDRD